MNKLGTRIYFDLDMWAWLQREAKERRVSVSHLIRGLVLQAMSGSRAMTNQPSVPAE